MKQRWETLKLLLGEPLIQVGLFLLFLWVFLCLDRFFNIPTYFY